MPIFYDGWDCQMLREDLLSGAQAIADHLGEDRRAVYYMIERGMLPVVRKGRRIFARRSELDRAFSSCADARA